MRGQGPPSQPTDLDIASRDKLPSLTGLRFWAALLVVLYHLTHSIGPVQPLSALAYFGRTGVTFFFVLSGFVLAWTYSNAAVEVRVFLWRRVARLWPLVAVTGLLSLVVYAALNVTVPPWRALSTFTFLQAWRTQWASGANPASWSLSAEAFFYLLFPALLAAAVRPRLNALLWVATGLALPLLFMLALQGGWMDSRFDYLPPSRLPHFVVGVLCGLAVRHGYRLRLSFAAAATVVIGYHAGVYGLSHVFGRPGWLFSGSQWWSVLPFALLIVAAAQADQTGRRTGVTGRWFLRLGHWSFAWYLVHEIVIRVFVHLFGRPVTSIWILVGWVLVLTVSLALAGTLYTVIEHPAELWLRNRGPGELQSPPAPRRSQPSHRSGVMRDISRRDP